MKSPEQFNDLTIPELIPIMMDYIRKGCVIHIKFTCPNCNKRITSDKPNAIHVKHPDVPYDEMVGDYVCGECHKKVHPTRFGMLLMTGFKIGDKDERTI